MSINYKLTLKDLQMLYKETHEIFQTYPEHHKERYKIVVFLRKLKRRINDTQK